MGLFRTSEVPKLQPREHDELTWLRIRYVQAFAIVTILIALVAFLATFFTDAPSLTVGQIYGIRLILVVISGANLFWLVLVSRGQERVAFTGFMFTFLIVGMLAPLSNLLIVLTAIVSGAVLLTDRFSYLAVMIILAAKMGIEIILYSGPPNVALPVVDFLTFTLSRIMIVFIGFGVRYFMRSIQNSVSVAQRSANLLRTSAEIGQVTTQIAEITSLFERVTTLIQERVGFYHVQVFLVTASGDQAELIASTGDVGRRLLARHHQLTVGSQSVIGQVTLRGEPVIAKDTDRDDVYFRNELLINTRSELALPIRDGANVVGALDVQSENADAFDRSDIQALQIIADFLGAAIRNSNQYQEQAKVAQENRRLLNEAEGNLREIQRLNRELTRATWEDYAKSDRAITGVTLENNRLQDMTEWTESLKAAGTEGHPVTAQEGERGVVAVPLKLRGEVIGAIEVEAINPTSQETIEMVEAVAQRLAISLENARLYEESREATAQEQFINDLAARYQSVSTVDELLRLTLLELGETLGAQHGAIRLGNVDAALNEPQNGAAAR